MANLLHIVASPRGESYSTRLAKAFLEAYRQARPQDRVETLDLFRADIPPFSAPAAKAKYSVRRRPATPRRGRGGLEARDRNHPPLRGGFDRYVVSSPMWNFGIPYRLKQYIDVIVQPSLTVAFSPTRAIPAW